MGKPAKRTPATTAVDAAEKALRDAVDGAQRAVDSIYAVDVEAARALLAAEQAVVALFSRPGLIECTPELQAARATCEAAEQRSAEAETRADEAVQHHVAFLDGPRQALILAVVNAKADAYDHQREKRRKPKKVDDMKRARIAELVRAGEPAKCIAGMVGLGTRTVEDEIAKLRATGVLPPSRRRSR